MIFKIDGFGQVTFFVFFRNLRKIVVQGFFVHANPTNRKEPFEGMGSQQL